MIGVGTLRGRIERIRNGGDAGVTLTELLVAITLFAILSTLIITSVTTISQTLARNRVATDNTNVASVGMDELTRIIRSGTSLSPVATNPAFLTASPEELMIYAYIDAPDSTPTPLKVQFKVNATTRDLVETRWKGTRTSTTAPWTFPTVDSTRIIARKIVTPASGEAPLFTYFEISSDLTEKAMTTPVTGVTDLGKIATVEIAIKVQTDPNSRADPVTILNRVGIPNLGISRLGAN